MKVRNLEGTNDALMTTAWANDVTKAADIITAFGADQESLDLATKVRSFGVLMKHVSYEELRP